MVVVVGRLLTLALAVLLSGCAAADPPAPAASTPSSAPAPAASAPAPAASAPPAASTPPAGDGALRDLERQYGARLGVYVIDTGTGHTIAYRADERFAHASTFKALLAGVLLRRRTDADLRRVVHYQRSDLLEYAPITADHVSTGMTVAELMAAALQYSDNTAANLLLADLGGAKALERELRALGDTTTTADRIEPMLNDAVPGATRDTSTPRGLGEDLRKLLLGDALPVARRTMLTDWMLGNTTGGPYIRAGVPSGWRVADKTGSGGYGTRNDIAVLWPASGAPIVLAVESDRGRPDATSDDALIADATRAVLAKLR
jgi:beta-lactamase class A